MRLTAKLNQKQVPLTLKKRAHTIREFSHIYNVSRSGVYVELARGSLKAIKLGSKTLITDDEAERWLKSLSASKVGDV